MRFIVLKLKRLCQVFCTNPSSTEDVLEIETTQQNLRSKVLKIFLFFLTITLGINCFHILQYTNYELKQGEQHIANFYQNFDEVIKRYFAMMYGVRAVYSLAPDMPHDMWKNYTQQVIYTPRYPGIYGVGVVRPVTLSSLTQFLEHDKKVNNRDLTSKVHNRLRYKKPTLRTNSTMGIVQYAFLADPTSSSFLGTDVFFDDAAKTIYDDAVKQDRSKLMYYNALVDQNGTEVPPALLIITPIFNKSMKESSSTARELNHLGWVITPIIIHEMISEIVNSTNHQHDLRINMSPIINGKPLVAYDSGIKDDLNVLISDEKILSIGGLSLKFTASFLHDGFVVFGRTITIPSEEPIIFAIGLVFCCLFTLFAWSVLTMRMRAIRIANRITQDLAKQEKQHREILSNVPGILFTTQINQTRILKTISGQFSEITGYSPEDFINNKTFRLVEITHPDDLSKVERVIGMKPEVNYEYFVDYRIMHRNGQTIWLHERAKTIRDPSTGELFLTGYIFDVTEQKNKEAEYRNLVHALENAVDGVSFIKQNGYHSRVNEAYTEIVGATPRELSFLSFYDMFDKEQEKAIRFINDEFIDNPERKSLRVLAKTYDGNEKHLSLMLIPIYRETYDRNLLGYYAFTRDISYEVKREMDLAKAVEAAESANKTKSTFLATMSHELRTPLNAIIGYSDMLIEDSEDSEVFDIDTVREDLTKINNAGRHLLTLINDILDVSKLEAGKMTLHYEVFCIKDVMESIIDMMRPTSEKNQNTLVLDIDKNIGEMSCDLTKMRQMVFNILSNACKFTKDGTITLRITEESIKNQSYIHFSVQDTGIGITQEQMKKLFHPFVQADSSTTRNFGGTGLGLTITKKFSEILGGHLKVSSTPNVGTTFTISLPRTGKTVVNDATTNLKDSVA